MRQRSGPRATRSGQRSFHGLLSRVSNERATAWLPTKVRKGSFRAFKGEAAAFMMRSTATPVATILARSSISSTTMKIEWLSDNGSCYVADETRSFARAIGLEPRTTPLESPQSNGMAEAFVRTIKRDYVRVSPRPDADTVMR